MAVHTERELGIWVLGGISTAFTEKNRVHVAQLLYLSAFAVNLTLVLALPPRAFPLTSVSAEIGQY